MAAAGAILVRTLKLLEGKVREGVTTGDLDRAAEKYIRSQGATPAFKGYRGFPGSICASPNSMVVHGIPGPYRLKRGDIISLDVGVVLDGWVADAARTFAVAPVSPVAEKLMDVTKASLFDAVEHCRAGGRLGDVSRAVQSRGGAEGLAIVRSLVGHGVGRSMPEEPQVPNYGEPGRGPQLAEGMGPAIDPRVNPGPPRARAAQQPLASASAHGCCHARWPRAGARPGGAASRCGSVSTSTSRAWR